MAQALQLERQWTLQHVQEQVDNAVDDERQRFSISMALSADFLGPIGFVAANLAANWPQAALVKRDVTQLKQPSNGHLSDEVP